MTARPVNDLAADLDVISRSLALSTTNLHWAESLARVEQAVARLETAEAQVAALTVSEGQSFRALQAMFARAEAAEAALADTRRALAEIAGGDEHGSVWMQEIASRALAAADSTPKEQPPPPPEPKVSIEPGVDLPPVRWRRKRSTPKEQP